MTHSNDNYAILVVDDDPLINRMLERILGAWKHEVVPAFSAEQAIGHARERDFDVVVADHNLGDRTDGLELLDRIEALHVESDRPVPALLIMSGERRAWPRPHVPKPFDFDALRALFAEHVG